WVSRARASTIRDNTPSSTQPSDSNRQDYANTVSKETAEQIKKLTEEEKKEIYMQYVNNEYGDVMSSDGVGDELMIDNLSGIYGIPYQFTDVVDPKPTGSSFGSVYASRIITRMPLLMLSPGKVDF